MYLSICTKNLVLYETQHCGNRPSMFSNVFKNMDFVTCALGMEGTNDNGSCIMISESSNFKANLLLISHIMLIFAFLTIPATKNGIVQ